MLIGEDPLFTEPLRTEENYFVCEDTSHSGSDIDVEEIDETFDFKLLEHCSRTLGWTRKSDSTLDDLSSRNKVPMIIPDESIDNSRKLTPAEMDPSDKSNTNKLNGQEGKKCSKCLVQFKSIPELRVHVEKKECFVIRCSFCNVLLLWHQLQEHVRNCSEKPLPYTCVICKKSFLLMQSLIGHQASHSSVNICFICGEAFTSNKKLKVHRKNCVSGKMLRSELRFPIFKCGECSSAYTKFASLKWHLRVKKHYVCLCGDCGISCPSFSSFRSHFQTVHGNWCYKCLKCGRNILDKWKWQVHVDACSKNKKYKCKSCALDFKSKLKYENHMKKSH